MLLLLLFSSLFRARAPFIGRWNSVQPKWKLDNSKCLAVFGVECALHLSSFSLLHVSYLHINQRPRKKIHKKSFLDRCSLSLSHAHFFSLSDILFLSSVSLSLLFTLMLLPFLNSYRFMLLSLCIVSHPFLGDHLEWRQRRRLRRCCMAVTTTTQQQRRRRWHQQQRYCRWMGIPFCPMFMC